MAAGVSKNNPDARKNVSTSKMVTSTDCEACKDQCEKGRNYLKRFAVRHEGNGVACIKK